MVHDTKAAKSTVKALREGRFIAMLADQGVLGLASTFVPFFRRPAKTPAWICGIRFAIDVPVCFMDMLRLPNGKFRVVFEPVRSSNRAISDKDTDAMVARVQSNSGEVGTPISRQYFWQHRRWRRQPEETPPELRDPRWDPSAWTPSR